MKGGTGMYGKRAGVVGISMLVAALLGGCAETPERSAAPASEAAASNGQGASSVREYTGSGEAWTARYAMYIPEGGGKMRGRLTVHYEAAGSAPTGELKYSYYGTDIESGSGTMDVKQSPAEALYLLRDLTTTEYSPDEAGTVELLLIWDEGGRTETIRLEPKKT